MSYDRFVDERLLTSRDALNKLQIKMKVVQIDENARDFSQRFGHRVLVQKVLLTIKYNDTEEVEEKELDVEEIEKRIKKERLFSSSNRWLASSDIKNGYVVASHHLDLLADAIRASSRDERGFASLREVGQRASARSSFDARSYGYSRLSELVEALPNFVTERRDGGLFIKRVR